MMSNYVIVVFVSFGSWHVHGSPSVCLRKPGVTLGGKRFGADGPGPRCREREARARGNGADRSAPPSRERERGSGDARALADTDRRGPSVRGRVRAHARARRAGQTSRGWAEMVFPFSF
jgi:hypothetical protein